MIAYQLNGGALMSGVSNPTSYTVESENITLQNPEKAGNIFLGWSGTGLEENTKTVIIPKGSVGNREYTVNWAEVAVTMDGWTYGDAPNEPVLGKDSNPGGGEVTYTYYTDSGCTTKTTAANGAAVEGGTPSYAGTYYVKAEVAASGGYNAASGTDSFTIEKKRLELNGERRTLLIPEKSRPPLPPPQAW